MITVWVDSYPNSYAHTHNIQGSLAEIEWVLSQMYGGFFCGYLGPLFGGHAGFPRKDTEDLPTNIGSTHTLYHLF